MHVGRIRAIAPSADAQQSCSFSVQARTLGLPLPLVLTKTCNSSLLSHFRISINVHQQDCLGIERQSDVREKSSSVGYRLIHQLKWLG
jgi:hypothetical protein